MFANRSISIAAMLKHSPDEVFMYAQSKQN